MTMPHVTEITPAMAAVEHDGFVDDLRFRLTRRGTVITRSRRIAAAE